MKKSNTNNFKKLCVKVNIDRITLKSVKIIIKIKVRPIKNFFVFDKDQENNQDFFKDKYSFKGC